MTTTKQENQQVLLDTEKKIAKICQNLEETLGLCVKSITCVFSDDIVGPRLYEIRIDSLELTVVQFTEEQAE